MHLSDFHLNDENLIDWDSYLKSEIIEMVKASLQNNNELYIVCTGDLIDKGGYKSNNINEAFISFKDKIITPIIESTKLPLDHFILAPGNHDIDRNADSDFENAGLKAKFKSEGTAYLNKYTRELESKEDKKGAYRIDAYHSFVKDLYKDCKNVSCRYLGQAFVFENSKINIGFACLNSAWCCYDDNDAESGVYIGEEQYNKIFNCIKKSTLKVALMHHPIDWLKLEKDTIGNWIYKDYDILLCGHVHNEDTTLKNKLYNNLFVNIAPMFTNEIRSKNISFANGFTMLDYKIESKVITANFYKYKLNEKKYILNTDYASSGSISYSLSNKACSNIDSIINYSSTYIKDHKYPVFDNMLIPQKANVLPSLMESFIMPPISKVNSEGEKDVTLIDIINNKSNILIAGASESGKSVLLFRLVIEYNNDIVKYGKLPVYIDFNEIGNREIESLIKDFCDLSSTSMRTLLDFHSIVLLVDNYNPNEESRHNTNKLYRFIKDNEIKCIATYLSEFRDIIPNSFINEGNEIAFEFYHLYQFKTENVKDLFGKWLPNIDFYQRNNKITKMVSNFCSYSLPCTAMSVSLYLWTTEKENKEPVNQAVLLDIYIEIILEKLSKENLYHNTFDYENKSMLISFIAYKMRELLINYSTESDSKIIEDTYKIEYNRYIEFITDYLKILGWENKYDAERLGNLFIDLKIFRKSVNFISFSHSCFYYFFLAKRMIKTPDFRKEILDENNYYKNDRVIEYYSGLVRSDEELLDILIDRFERFFIPVEPFYNKIDFDESFTDIIEGAPKYRPKVESVTIDAVVSKRPTIETIEKRMIKVCDDKLQKISDKFRKNQQLSPESLIVMLAKALRNLDSVENVKLKQKGYNCLVKSALIFTVILKDSLASYANAHSGELPPAFSHISNIEQFFRFMPFAMQMNINEFMGTTKLETIFLNKYRDDLANQKSDIEKYFSLAMIWDNSGQQYFKEMKSFIKSVGQNCVQDYLYFKLLHIYYFQISQNSEGEDIYLELLLRLTRKRKLFPYLTDSQVKKQISSAKEIRIPKNI